MKYQEIHDYCDKIFQHFTSTVPDTGVIDGLLVRAVRKVAELEKLGKIARENEEYEELVQITLDIIAYSKAGMFLSKKGLAMEHKNN